MPRVVQMLICAESPGWPVGEERRFGSYEICNHLNAWDFFWRSAVADDFMLYVNLLNSPYQLTQVLIDSCYVMIFLETLLNHNSFL